MIKVNKNNHNSYVSKAKKKTKVHLSMPSAKNDKDEQLFSRPLTVQLCLATPVGRLLLQACPVGLHSLTMTDPESMRPCMQMRPRQLLDSAASTISIAEQPDAHENLAHPVKQTLAWLIAYFDLTPLPPLPILCATSAAPPGSFRRRVWRALATSVPFGATVSYQQLAAMAGAAPSAARAVGSAMRANPVPLLVPCHRVVRANGSLGHFAGGKADATKRWLLEHERAKPLPPTTGLREIQGD